MANKAVWHNKSKVRGYGELFREGDTIGVNLDMDLGTLWFTRNGRDLGVAVQGLVGELYPAFSMYNKDDQLTLIPPHMTGPGGGSAGDGDPVDGPDGVPVPISGMGPQHVEAGGMLIAERHLRHMMKAAEALKMRHLHMVRPAAVMGRIPAVANVCLGCCKELVCMLDPLCWVDDRLWLGIEMLG